MKIIKAPKFDVSTCKCCGTVFEAETKDEIVYQEVEDGYEILAVCPTCDRWVKINEVTQNENRQA